MSNRAVFVTSFLIAMVILFAAFSLTQLFYFHLFESLIYVLIALMVFYGENRYSYMLGIVVPSFWLLMESVMGYFRDDVANFLLVFTRQTVLSYDSALHGAVSMLSAILLFYSVRVYRREVGRTGLGKSLAVSGGVAAIYYAILLYWYTFGISQGRALPL